MVAIVILQLRQQTSFDLTDDEEYYPESYDSNPVQNPVQIPVRTQLVTNEVYQPVEKVLKKLVSLLHVNYIIKLVFT